MAKRYMDFAPRKRVTGVAGGAQMAGGTRTAGGTRAARPEITMPKPRPVQNEAPIRLMPTEKVVRRTEVIETEVVQPQVKKAPVRPVRKVARPSVSGVKPSVSGVRAAARPKPRVAAQPTGVARPTTGAAKPVPEAARPVQPKPVRRPLQQRATELMRRRRPAPTEVPMEMVDDPLERPVSEFADLEELAQEIEEVTRGGVVEEETQFVATSEEFSLKQAPKYGVVEDFQPRFLDTEVEKRPLSQGMAAMTGATVADAISSMEEAEETTPGVNSVEFEITEVEAEPTGVANNAGMNSAAMRTLAARQNKMQIPNAKFINQNKVAKRPLSKTAYTEAGYGTVAGTTTGVTMGAKEAAKSIGAKKKTKKAKKEIAVVKDRHKGGALGMVLAIIVTVILGAAVGTVAFLILPR